MKLLQWLFPEKAAKLAAAKCAIAETDNLSGVGALAEALWLGDDRTRREAERTLEHLLPRLRDTDAALLNVEQRHCLYRALRGNNPTLKLAILKALEVVGDATAVRHVERLAEEIGKTRTQERVNQAARECLPYLQARVQKMQATKTLLRSSNIPAVSMDNLRQPEQGNKNI